jgi:hypothetical protein
VGLYAAKDVSPAQELTFDYGPEFYPLVGGKGGGSKSDSGGGGKGRKSGGNRKQQGGSG